MGVMTKKRDKKSGVDRKINWTCETWELEHHQEKENQWVYKNALSKKTHD